MTFRTKFLLVCFDLRPPNNPITACGATSFLGCQSFQSGLLLLLDLLCFGVTITIITKSMLIAYTHYTIILDFSITIFFDYLHRLINVTK